jgi:hypothetical protein
MAISVTKAIKAAKGSKGFITQIAKNLNCSRTYVYDMMVKYPEFKQAIEDERETLKDFAEGALFKQINDGNTTAIIFYLKCQAKDRGYVERQEVMASNLNIDTSKLTNEQLERIANGEDPLHVVVTS